MRAIRPRRLSALMVGAVLSLAVSASVALPAAGQEASDAPAPVLADLTADGGALATRFLEILGLPEAEKATELDLFLAPEFQLVRATGARLDRTAYLAAPATVSEFLISDVMATQTEDVVVISYLLATTETIDGLEQTTTAPRLSVFHWDGAGWQLAAHSNFGAISASAGPSASPAG